MTREQPEDQTPQPPAREPETPGQEARPSPDPGAGESAPPPASAPRPGEPGQNPAAKAQTLPEDPDQAPEPDPDEPGETIARSGEDDGLRELIAGNFLEYASYVIKDRAIPDVTDGLKPVQRRILHSLYELDDGRFHKVANVIGHTMRYHPHGDASIGSALVVLANKEYFIDRQGNFGNIYTGDPASAARYIECRLSPLAREVLFNPEITEFIDSYDGRNREPVTLPAKVPALLMMGSEGIAVGMSTRILPHNFRELLEAQIAILENKPFEIYPDFQTGGIMDVADYDDGRGRVKVRALIETAGNKTLVIREIPAGCTTESLMASIENAARKGHVKIAGIHDYTAETPEIEIKLARGEKAAGALKRLYAYTDCEVSLSSNIIVIRDQRPVSMTVSEILRFNTEKLVEFLTRELEILLHKLQERFHEKTLAQIFIENRIYKRIEKCETWEKVMAQTRAGLEKFRHLLRRDITDADIEKLLQLQIRRISLFDINKNRKDLDDILADIAKTEDNLAHITRYAVHYLRALIERFGDQFPRRTRIADIEAIRARDVALENRKVGHDRVNRFVGTEVRNSNKNEPYLLCSDYDHLVLLRSDGTFKVIPVPEKEYVGPVKYLMKADKSQVYSMLYRDKKSGKYFAKRFRIDKYILNREYRTIPEGCIIENLYTNSGVVVRCEFQPNPRRKQASVDVNFDEIPLRSTSARGFKITDRKIVAFTQIRRGIAAAEAPDQEPEKKAAPPSPAPPSPPPESSPEPPARQAPPAESEPAPDAPPRPAEAAKNTEPQRPDPEAASNPTPAPPSPEPPPAPDPASPETPAANSATPPPGKPSRPSPKTVSTAPAKTGRKPRPPKGRSPGGKTAAGTHEKKRRPEKTADSAASRSPASPKTKPEEQTAEAAPAQSAPRTRRKRPKPAQAPAAPAGKTGTNEKNQQEPESSLPAPPPPQNKDAGPASPPGPDSTTPGKRTSKHDPVLPRRIDEDTPFSLEP